MHGAISPLPIHDVVLNGTLGQLTEVLSEEVEVAVML
jgi:hypothetical protein